MTLRLEEEQYACLKNEVPRNSAKTSRVTFTNIKPSKKCNEISCTIKWQPKIFNNVLHIFQNIILRLGTQSLWLICLKNGTKEIYFKYLHEVRYYKGSNIFP